MEPATLLQHLISDDQTIHKYIFSGTRNGTFETGSFFNTRGAVHDICVSTMAGCMLGCRICATTYAAVPFERVLTDAEITLQVATAVQARPKDANPETRLRIGFMGNGEPLLNADNVIRAIRGIEQNDEVGKVFQYSFSTLGSQPQRAEDFAALAKELGVRIWMQYSLCHFDPSKRKEVFPFGQPLTVCIPHWDRYAEATGLAVYYNIPLIAGFNDDRAHLDQLANFINERPALRHLRLSTFNVFPGVDYRPVPDDEIIEKGKYLSSLGVSCSIFFGDRDPSVVASCGQLRAETFTNSALAKPRSLIRKMSSTRAPWNS